MAVAAGVSGANEELVELADTDELVRHVGRLCAAGFWDELVDLRDRCLAAAQRGRQLWGVASLAEYRLALDAPGPWAAAVLTDGTGQRALGPLPEVAASTHTWAELADHIPPGPLRSVTAHERAVRGEQIPPGAVPEDWGVPLGLASWEPDYPTATYGPDRLEAPRPELPARHDTGLVPAGEPSPDPLTEEALREVVAPWVTGSNGRAEVVATRGSAMGAVSALGVPRLRAVEVSAATAVAHVSWAAASGGAHGRRRGMAAGRFEAWWLMACLGGVTEDWPVTPDEIGDIASELRWWLWDAGEPDTGWHLRLAVEDPLDGLAWAISASDAA